MTETAIQLHRRIIPLVAAAFLFVAAPAFAQQIAPDCPEGQSANTTPEEGSQVCVEDEQESNGPGDEEGQVLSDTLSRDSNSDPVVEAEPEVAAGTLSQAGIDAAVLALAAVGAIVLGGSTLLLARRRTHS